MASLTTITLANLNGTDMQFSLSIYSLTEIPGCMQYLAGSKTRKKSETMKYVFPDIHKDCPVCHGERCAIWKGYYSRKLFCQVLGFFDSIWVRKGLCKTTGTHFSMLPDFCIPGIRWGKLFFLNMLEVFESSKKSFFNSFDFDIPFSSLYWMGAYLVQLLRLNAELFSRPPSLSSSNSVLELKNYSFEPTKKVLLRSDFVWSKRIIRSGNSPPI